MWTAAALLGLTLPAQAQWRDFGPRIVRGDEVLASALDLGFSFPMPDGSTVQRVDASANGRVFASGASSPDRTPSVAELLSTPSTLCPLWRDLVVDGGIHFARSPGTATITWEDARPAGQTTPFTMQLQLIASGQLLFLFDSRSPAVDGLCGVSAGRGPDPGSIDLGAGLPSGAGATIYEQFGSSAPFDLAGQLLSFTPLGPGAGYALVSGAVGDPSLASIRTARRGCAEGAITWQPDGSGGYLVLAAGSADFTLRQGRSLPLGDDDSVVVPLALPVTLPGGTRVSSLEISSNGRVYAPGASRPDFSPTPFDLLGSQGGVIAPYWTDLNPRGGGGVYASTGVAGTTVTWDAIPKLSGTRTNTFQLRLLPDDSIQFVYIDVDLEDIGPNGDLLIGLSAGFNVPDPGPLDLSSLPTATGGRASGYEFFAPRSGGRAFDLNATTPGLTATAPPVLGATFTLQVTDVPPLTSGVAFWIGRPTLISFGAIPGFELCALLTDASIAISPALPPGAPLAIPVPNDTGLLRQSFNVQALAVGIGGGSSSLSFQLSNELVGQFGR